MSSCNDYHRGSKLKVKIAIANPVVDIMDSVKVSNNGQTDVVAVSDQLVVDVAKDDGTAKKQGASNCKAASVPSNNMQLTSLDKWPWQVACHSTDKNVTIEVSGGGMATIGLSLLSDDGHQKMDEMPGYDTGKGNDSTKHPCPCALR